MMKREKKKPSIVLKWQSVLEPVGRWRWRIKEREVASDGNVSILEGNHEVIVSEAALDGFGSVIQLQTTSLQPLQTFQSFTYLTSAGRHSSSGSNNPIAAAAAAYNNDGYQQQQHGSGGAYHQHRGNPDHHGHYGGNASGSNSTPSGRMVDPNLHKIDGIPSYKTALHGAAAQIYTLSPPPSIYDQTATLYSGTAPNIGTTITYNTGESGNVTNSIQYGSFISFSIPLLGLHLKIGLAFYSKLDGIIQVPWSTSGSPMDNYNSLGTYGGSYVSGSGQLLSLDSSPILSGGGGGSGGYGPSGGTSYMITSGPVGPGLGSLEGTGMGGGPWQSSPDGCIHILHNGDILRKVEPGMSFNISAYIRLK